jgi:hypothetical protein
MGIVPLLAAGAFALASPDFRPGGPIAAAQAWNRDGCTGANRPPALRWTHAPSGTKSFALTVFDPDAPTGHGWWHWLAFDIPPAQRDLPARHAASTSVAFGVNDFGSVGYGGPCPPPGPAHHYVFTLYALSVDRLSPAHPHPNGSDFATLISGHVLDKATLIGTFAR